MTCHHSQPLAPYEWCGYKNRPVLTSVMVGAMSLLSMYQRFAELCSESASATTTPEVQEQWMAMAIRWRQKAEEAERLETGLLKDERASPLSRLPELSELSRADHLRQPQTVAPALAPEGTGCEVGSSQGLREVMEGRGVADDGWIKLISDISAPDRR